MQQHRNQRVVDFLDEGDQVVVASAEALCKLLSCEIHSVRVVLSVLDVRIEVDVLQNG